MIWPPAGFRRHEAVAGAGKAHVHLVQRVQNRHSVWYNMTIKELRESMAATN